MKAKRWMFAALVAGGALFAARGCSGCLSGGSDPDEKLAAQFDDLCQIAKGGIKDPVKGVRKLGKYLVLHTGDMMKNFGDTFGMIERIRDDEKHDQRAMKARDTMFVPLQKCAATWDQFGQAIEGNQEALELVGHAAERLDRTINIIFASGTKFTLRGLPSELQRAIGMSLDQK